MKRDAFYVDNRSGWDLHAERLVCADAPPLHPVVLLPGYGMNGFILGYHPSGMSMKRSLAEAGFEVWTVHLSRQGPSRPRHTRARAPGLRAYAIEDLPALMHRVLDLSTTGAQRADLIGCSLGGSVAYAHLALCPQHRVHSLVTLGAPLRWSEVHPAMRLAFSSRRLAGAIPFAGTRRMARYVFPVLARHLPWALSIYVNTKHVDPAIAPHITQTVDDPHPALNRDIAQWMHTEDLILDGVNITEALRRCRGPLRLVLCNRDGIVPEPTARVAAEVWGGEPVAIQRVGSEQDWFAHADLYLAPDAPERVFTPIADWLIRQRS